jgi:hypothetical protein
MSDSHEFKIQYVDDLDPFNVLASIKHVEPTVPKKFKVLSSIPLIDQLGSVKKALRAPHKIEECTLLALREDKVAYLDTEATIDELIQDEVVICDRSTSIVLRTKLSLRVHTIIDTLLSAEGRRLRNSLFCLKRMFQDDEALVYEFVGNEGLSCLLKVGLDSDPTFCPYILKAIGEIIVYVDGMNGLIRCPEVIEWLYSLIESKYRTVSKAAIDLLVVFVSYQEPSDHTSMDGVLGSAYAFKQAVESYSAKHDQKPWQLMVNILQDKSVTADSEVQAEVMTLVNKVRTHKQKPDLRTYIVQTIVYTGFLLIPKFLVV